jgi:ribosome recycling factor
MEELDLLLEEAKEQMNKAYNHVGSELGKIRAGKASPNMLDSVQVPYYGAMSPLNQVSSITAPEARTLFIRPFEKSLIQEIERAIINANLGFNPQNDGLQVIINIPMLTEERRKQLVKQASHECENGKISVRSVRKEINEMINDLKGISEDDQKNGVEVVQKLTDEHIAKIEALMKKKEVEIMTV